MAKKTVTETEIRKKAYEMWTDEGQPHGQDQDHWYRAEAELAKPTRKAAAKKPATKAASTAKSAAKPAAAKKTAARKPAAKTAAKAKTTK